MRVREVYEEDTEEKGGRDAFTYISGSRTDL